MKLLVIGRSGQVARALARRSGDVVALGRPELDLERPETIAAAIAAHEPDVAACVGAYTAVDAAESNEDEAYRVNAIGPEAVAQACAARDLPLILVSTDYVFDGAKAGPYVETDATHPATAYGRTKRAGERLALAANPRTTVVRTAWVYDAEGKNFVRTMLRLARTRERLGVVDDQRGCPSFADDIADGLIAIAARLSSDKRGDLAGMFHMSGAGACTWRAFAEAIFAGAAARGGPSAAVDAITTADYPTPAKRPANSVLDCAKLARVYGVRLPSWEDGLSRCLDQIARIGWPD